MVAVFRVRGPIRPFHDRALPDLRSPKHSSNVWSAFCFLTLVTEEEPICAIPGFVVLDFNTLLRLHNSLLVDTFFVDARMVVEPTIHSMNTAWWIQAGTRSAEFVP